MVILQNLVDVSLSHAMRACRSSQKFGRRYGPCSPDLVGVADSWKHATPPHVLHTEFYRSRQIHMDVSKPPPKKKGDADALSLELGGVADILKHAPSPTCVTVRHQTWSLSIKPDRWQGSQNFLDNGVLPICDGAWLTP